MPLGQPLSALNLYDIQGNLIPGITFLLVAFVLVYPWNGPPSVLVESPVVLLAYALTLGVVSGRLLQAVGSALDSRLNEGVRLTFEARLAEFERADGAAGEDFLGARFVSLCEEHFELPADRPKDADLLHLLMSYFETHGVGRSMRFEALHSFYRSIWSASVSALAVALLVAVGKATGASVGPGWPTLLALGAALAVVAYAFYVRKRKFERVFVDTVIRDFYQDQVTDR